MLRELRIAIKTVLLSTAMRVDKLVHDMQSTIQGNCIIGTRMLPIYDDCLNMSEYFSFLRERELDRDFHNKYMQGVIL